MTGPAPHTPVRGQAWIVARRAAIGPAALLAFQVFAYVWPGTANAWGGLPGLAALCLVAAAYIAGGVRAGVALGMGPRVAGALGATHLAIGVVTYPASMLAAAAPSQDPVGNWIGGMLVTAVTAAYVAGVPLVALVAFLFVPGRRVRLASRAAASFLVGAAGACLLVALAYAVTAPFDALTGTGPFPGPASARDAALRFARVPVALAGAIIGFVIGALGVAHAIGGD